MNSDSGRQIWTLALGILALLLPGCADMPAWVPFQGARSDDLPGVVTPAAKIAQLKNLSSEAAKSDQDSRHRVVGQLVAAIRSETDSLIRAEIIRTLGDYPDPAADPVLKAAINDPDADVRIAACEAWGKRGNAQAAELLVPVLSSDVSHGCPAGRRPSLGKNQRPAGHCRPGRGLDRLRSGHAIPGRFVA